MFKILVVDASPAFHQYVQRTIAPNLKVEIVFFFNGEDAMEFLQTEMPALILLEIGMDAKTGVDFLRDLRQDETYQNTPIIILSSDRSSEIIEITKPFHVSDYVVKRKLDKATLLQAIKTALVRARIPF
jgi:CheY-like chemotaxis protein